MAVHTIENIVLIRPPTVLPKVSFTTAAGVPSLALAYLAAALKRAGYRVTVIDALGEAIDSYTPLEDDPALLANGLSTDEIIARIPEDTHALGISCMFSNEWIYHRRVVNAITDRFPDLPVILGGEHVTAVPEHTFDQCPDIAAVVMGEGEAVILDLIDALGSGKPLDGVEGIVFKDEARGGLTTTPARSRIRQVGDLPWPDWESVPLLPFLDREMGHGIVRGRNLPVMASRGCPFKCSFCSNPLMWGKRWEVRPVDDVIAEIKEYGARYRTDSFSFYDLTAIIRRDWIMEFTARLIEEDLGLEWFLPTGTRSEVLDQEVLTNLYRSGCRSLTYAPESGSPETLKRIRKKIKLDVMLRSMRSSVRASLLTKANIVIGFPGETKREVLRTFGFIFKMALAGVHDVAVFPYVPYPGSEFYRLLADAKRIPAEDDPAYIRFLSYNTYNQISEMRSWSEHVSDTQIRFLTVSGMAWFYFCQYAFRPWRILATSRRLLASAPETMLERLFDSSLKRFRKTSKTASDDNSNRAAQDPG